MSGLILHLTISQSHVFLLNSRLDHFSAPYSRRGPFSLSYRTNLPSSLATVHSSTFGFSPRPPVSVYGTGGLYVCLESFLESRLPACVKSPYGSLYCLRSAELRICLQFTTFRIQRAIPSARLLSAPLSFLRHISRYRNINRLSIDCACRLRLRPGLTLIRLSLIRKPWSSGVRVSHSHYRYLCLHLLFCSIHKASRLCFISHRMLPYQQYVTISFHGFGSMLMPVYYPCRTARLVSCYALFK